VKLTGEEIRAKRQTEPAKQAVSPPQTYECGSCKTKFTIPAGWAGEPVKCPNPDCPRTYTKEELQAP